SCMAKASGRCSAIARVPAPTLMRPANATSAAVNGAGGMKKSRLLMLVPAGVVTAMRPDPAPAGTVTTSAVAVADASVARATLLKTIRLFATVVSNPVPLSVTSVPGVATAGENSAMAGALRPGSGAVTTNGCAVVAEPF